MKPRFISLKIKFTLITFFVGFVSFSVAAILANQWMPNEFEKAYRQKAFLIWTHVIDDIEAAMVTKIHGDIPKVLGIYRAHRDVKELRLFNLGGQEVFAEKDKNPSELGVGETLRTGELIHIERKIDKIPVTSYIIPVKNKPECHSCHGERQSLRGALLVSFSLEDMNRDIARQRNIFLIIFALMSLGICILSIVAVNSLFLKPLSQIQKGTEAIGGGHFDYQIPNGPKDEIGVLTENLNEMARILHGKNEDLWEQFRLVSRSQKEWQETFDAITDLICVIDKDFNIVKANRAFHEYFSLSPHEEMSKKCHQLLGTCHGADCLHIKGMENGKPLSSEIYEAKTGKILQLSFFPYFSSEGHPLGSILVGKDITEKRESQMRLIMNERLTALGQMASGVAHEINNPLATISACTEGLIKRIEKGQINVSLFENYLKIIDEEVKRGRDIVESILSFVRKRAGEKNDIDINETLEKTLDLIGFQGRLRDVEILRNYLAEMPTIKANEGELRQVFLSIMGNALDAMEDRGKLILETNINGDNEIVIKISDMGPGIPSSLINRIFEPFFTTKSAMGGTGLGLAIANRIIKENRGRIEVSSEEGKGTTFIVTLPT